MSAPAPSFTPDLSGPHRFAVLLACCVVFLIGAGGLVKSLEAGLSVPDWPTSYGGINPPRWWTIENVRAEHGHRLIAGTVALMTVALCVWIHRRDDRRAVRRLSLLAVVAVLLQALLGGITVLLFLPKSVSVSHAALAQLFLALIVTLAVVTGPRWPRGVARAERTHLLRWAPVLTVAVFAQILIGAVVRHSGAGLAIPDFPLVFGRLVPPQLDFQIGVHYLHRLGALAVAGLVAVVIVEMVRSGREDLSIRLPAFALGALVALQVALGAMIIWTGRAVGPNTLHVAVGAMVFATSVLLSLQSWRLGPVRTVGVAAVGELQEASS
jgi:cytochrome c oxidase assembly protein subunit 15